MVNKRDEPCAWSMFCGLGVTCSSKGRVPDGIVGPKSWG